MSTNPKRSSIARSTVIVMAGMVLANLAGFLQKILVANAFGTNAHLDAFIAANRIPEFLFYLFAGGALASAFIPTYTGFLTKDDQSGADRLVSAVATWIFILLGVSSILCAIFADPIMRYLISPFFPESTLRESISLFRILLICPTIFASSGLVMGILNSHHRFFFAAMAPMFYPVGMILGIWLFVPSLGIFGLAWGAVLGAGLHLGCQLPGLLALRSWYGFSLGFGNPAVGEIIRLMAPRLIGSAAVQLNFVVNVILASSMPEGSLAAISLAFTLMLTPLQIIAQASAIAAMPTFSAQASRGDVALLRNSLTTVARSVLFLAIPASVGLILLANSLLRIFFEYGLFDERSVQMTAWALVLYTLGLASHSLLEVLSRGFYALKDTFTPVVFSTLGMGVNIILSIALVRVFGGLSWMPHGGLALATTVASFMETIALLLLLQRKLGSFLDSSFWISLGRTCLASLGMGIVIWGVQYAFGLTSEFLKFFAGLFFGGIAFLIFALVFRSPEVLAFLTKWKKKSPDAIAP